MSTPDDPRELGRLELYTDAAKLWILVEASRWTLSVGILLILFGSFVTLGAFAPVPLEQSIAVRDPVETLFSAFTTAIITGVTLVVTINQLVLTNKLGSLNEQRERIDGAIQFRKDVEETLGVPVISAHPTDFMDTLIEVVRRDVQTLRDGKFDSLDEPLQHEIARYVEDVVGDAEEAHGHLRESQFGTFEPLFAVLEFDYSWKIHEARELRALHGDEFDDEMREALDDLVEILELFAPAREYFKALYFQWEFINLSRVILYVAFPALVVSVGMILNVGDPSTVEGFTFGVSNTVWLVSAAAAMATFPFVVLVTFILRIATVTKRTLAIGPFMLRETIPYEGGPDED